MLATLIIFFRETMEAGLVVSIALAATLGVVNRSLWVGYGIIAGIICSCIVALFTKTISSAVAGFGQELFNVVILVAAVIMLTSHNVWMARHGREIIINMKKLGEEVTNGKKSLLALAIVVAIAVLREGSEVVLFVYGIIVSSHESYGAISLGAIAGLLMAILLSVAVYLGMAKIPNRYLFKVTSIMLAMLAAGMSSQAMAFLEQAQIVNILTQTLWNTSWLVADGSLLGKALHTLIGYTAAPSIIQMLAYVLTLLVTFLLMHFYGRMPAHSKIS